MIGLTVSMSFDEPPVLMSLFLLNILMMILSVVLVIISGYGNNEVRYEEVIYDLFKRNKKRVVRKSF